VNLELLPGGPAEIPRVPPRNDPPPVGRAGPTPLWYAGWVGVGVGVAGAASLGVFAALADGKFRDLRDRCDDTVTGRCPESLRGELQTGYAYQVAANVSIGVAAGALGLGALLVVLGRPRERAPVQVSTDGRSVFVTGWF
jgi:hypothetical protein